MIRFKTSLFWLPLLLMLPIALAACGNGPEDLALQGSLSNDQAIAGASQTGGPLVPDFTVSTGDGSSFSLSGHRGEIILLFFSFPG